MAVALSEVESCDSSIPDELTSIDALKCSEECRLGRYLIELAFERSLKVSPWDETFFRLARQLYLHLNQRQKKSLVYSYCFGRVLPSVIAIFPVARRAIELYDLGKDLTFIRFVLEIEAQIGEQLELADHEYLFEHRTGCSARALEAYLKPYLSFGQISNCFNKGRLSCPKDSNGNWLIDTKLQARIMVLSKKRTTIHSFAEKEDHDTTTLYGYAALGDFGEVGPNISGRLCFKTEMLAEIRDRVENKIANSYSSRVATTAHRKYRKDEVSSVVFAKMLGVERQTVASWIVRKLLKGRVVCEGKSKKSYAIQRKGGANFILRVAKGEIGQPDIRQKVINRCCELAPKIEQCGSQIL